ncbi:MAG: IS3 family transposase, partial [Cyanobacteria bacterium REEB65]|nr:IS3 family transposase [Cyanobacteria bacterium REEB65]
MMADALLDLAGEFGWRKACTAMGMSRATLYRRPKAQTASPPPREAPAWALSGEEREEFLHFAHSNPDLAPMEIYCRLLDAGRYICSPRTMYRILADYGEVRERRDQLRHPKYARPELLATGPRQLWSWDITKLRGPGRGVYYHLYVLIDVYSRYVVAWMLAERESGQLATTFLREACRKEGIRPGQLTIHSDRGPAMKEKTVVDLHARLGLTKSHSRPYVSNDNPYSESQFKTMKYRPEFPDRFGSFEDARAFCDDFFHWYNHEHFHSGICWLTPACVHFGEAAGVLESRHATLLAAFERMPERFLGRPPRPRQLPAEVWINRPTAA